jgi:hypothetical protein
MWRPAALVRPRAALRAGPSLSLARRGTATFADRRASALKGLAAAVAIGVGVAYYVRQRAARPPSPDVVEEVRRGHGAIARGDFRGAVDSFARAAAILRATGGDPLHAAEVALWLGDAEERLGRAADAERSFRTVAALVRAELERRGGGEVAA